MNIIFLGVMVVCLILCGAIVVIIVVRQRKNRKLASPAYSGLKLVQPERITVDVKNMQMTVVPVNGNPVATLGRVKGNVYIMDAQNCKVSKVDQQPESFYPSSRPSDFTGIL